MRGSVARVPLLVAAVLAAATAAGAGAHSADGVTSADAGDAGGARVPPPSSAAPHNGTSPLTSVDRIDNRTWATSTQDAIRHEGVKSYVEYLAGGSAWNQQRSREYIAAYNAETEIGRNVNAHEIAALVAKRSILGETADHTPQQEKFYRWAFEEYGVPDSAESIDQRLAGLVGEGDKLRHVQTLADTVNAMVDAGGVPEEVDIEDGEFWSKTRASEYCRLTPGCDWDVEAMADRLGRVTPVTTFGHHIATIHLVYDPCEATMPTCFDFKRNVGTGIKSRSFPSIVTHIQDPTIFVRLTNYGVDYDHVVATAQLTGPGQTSNTVTVYDVDGYVNDYGYLSNQNARSESAVYTTFKSWSYAP